ncbi:MAG: acyl-CoA dehydrogenase [Acidimicrobiales bacterium]|nr:acyl-CoA dehydrogenase [Acidimicrobiales bacterium]
MSAVDSPAEIEDQVRSWVDDHWDPDLRLGDWWQLLADSGFAHPMLPENAGGKGWGQSQAMRVMRALAAADVVGPPTGLGYMLAAPTIAEHGTDEQIERYIPNILNGREAWCQLFSEPVAGSDLAGLQSRAIEDGDEWRVTGQKVWTSQGNIADLGMLVARTDPDAPKHRGLSYFVLEMDQDGVDVRPLKEMTGRTFFSEVFMDDAIVAADAMIGDRGDGWRVANTTLAVERASIGAGMASYAKAQPGSKVNAFDRRVGDVVERSKRPSSGGHAPNVGMKLFDRYVELGRSLGRLEDPVLRQELMELYSDLRVNRMNIQRARQKSQRTGGEPNIAKLIDGELHRRFRDVSLRIIQADGMLSGPSSSTDPTIAELVLYAQAPPIYGGTDQIQRNILGERVLGLPKEPGFDKNTPFSELPKNV